MTRTLLLAALLLFPGVAAAQSFNFGVTPTIIDEGVVAPGSTFHGEFHVLSTSPDNLSVRLSTAPGTLSEARYLEGVDPARFSAQPCPGCVTFLAGGGDMPRRDRSLAVQGGVDRWDQVSFLVHVPETVEPGHHIVQVSPVPETRGGQGVGLVSTANLPLVFRVPGAVVRDGTLLGIRKGDRIRDRQELVATFYNSGTVTMKVSTGFTLVGAQNITVPGASARVAPDTTETFTTTVPIEALNTTKTVHAAADFGTGNTHTAVSFPLERPPEQPPDDIFLYLLLLAATIVTAWVVRRG